MLTLRLDETEENLDNLMVVIDTQREILETMTADIKEMSEKIDIVEDDLKRVKGAQKDIALLDEIRRHMEVYRNNFSFNGTLLPLTTYSSSLVFTSSAKVVLVLCSLMVIFQ